MGLFMAKKKLVEDIKLSPQRFYRSPSDVVRDRRFSDAERLEILEAWEKSAADSDQLQQVVEARQDFERKLTADDVSQSRKVEE
jgi:hypothetical protein